MNYTITNTIMANNSTAGFFYLTQSGSATSIGSFDHVVATNNASTGFAFNTKFGGGATTISITNSTSSNNGSDGFFLTNTAAMTGSIDNSAANNNSLVGIDVEGTAQVTLSRSIVTGNPGTGLIDGTSGHTFYTFGNNQIALNNPDNIAALNNSVYSLH